MNLLSRLSNASTEFMGQEGSRRGGGEARRQHPQKQEEGEALRYHAVAEDMI